MNKHSKRSLNEVRAYWIGVGIGAERHKDGNKCLDSKNTKLRNAVRSGYSDDNYKNISKKVFSK